MSIKLLEGEFSRQVEGNVALLSYPEYLNYRDRVAGVSGLAASADVKLYLGGNNVEKINGLNGHGQLLFASWRRKCSRPHFFRQRMSERLFNVRSPFLVTVSGSEGLDLIRSVDRHFAHTESPALHCNWSGGTGFSRRRDDRSRCLDSSNDAACGDAGEQVSGARRTVVG